MDSTHGILNTIPQGSKLLDTRSDDLSTSSRKIPLSASNTPKRILLCRETSSDDSSTSDSSEENGFEGNLSAKDYCLFIAKILLTIPLFIIGTAIGAIYGVVCGFCVGLLSMPCRSIDSEVLSPAQKICMTPVLCLCCPLILTITWTADGLFSGGYVFCSNLWNGRPIWVDIDQMKENESRPCIPPILNTLGQDCVSGIDINTITRR
ncbi:hypothetical protein [Kistimonas asteriae]|uniref:hypothetical protein n=1 Tax=Kistimonas asteriae TaxID=517724 RepID=UPI001BAA7985|nr:hypothetical protein [Kistimonas asteriae]